MTRFKDRPNYFERLNQPDQPSSYSPLRYFLDTNQFSTLAIYKSSLKGPFDWRRGDSVLYLILDMRRRLEVDALRGLMLVWMTLTHLPTGISVYSYQPIGFLSSAEGFIFLSALFTGLIYFRTAIRDGIAEMRLRLWGRTLKIYGYHLLMMALAFLFAPLIAGVNHPGLHNLLDFYFSVGFRHASVDAALLAYRPPLLDILPMYVIFMGLTPLLITVARYIGWRSILAGSLVLWLMAQLGLREAAYVWMSHLGLRIPLNEMGAFDVWAWQLVWVVGLWCGVRWAQSDLPLTEWAGKITVPAAAIVVARVGRGTAHRTALFVELRSRPRPL